MQKHINQGDVPRSMVAACPWGSPLEQWSNHMLRRGYSECVSSVGGKSRDPNSPNLARAIQRELQQRRQPLEVS